MLFFKSHSNYINPSEYTINSKDGSVTYIIDGVTKSKKELAELCNLACPSLKPERKNLKLIIKSAKSILDITSEHAKQFYNMALETADVKQFFDSIDVAKRDYERMSAIEKYVYYNSAPSNIAIYNLNRRLQVEIRHLIDRAYKYSRTAKDPDNMAQKQYNEFQKHLSLMEQKSIDKLYSKYKKYIQ